MTQQIHLGQRRAGVTRHEVRGRVIDARRLVRVILCAGSLIGVVHDLPAAELFPAALTQFEPIPGNPIFTARGSGHWDVRIRERGWIVHHGGQYLLYFTGYDGTREGQKMLGLATSDDGVHWKRESDSPIYSAKWIEDVMVVPHRDKLYMFAEGAQDQAHLLESTDGRKWKSLGPLDVRQVSGERIPPGPLGTPTAMMHDGRWYLFYERRDAGIWLATSSDMKVWTNVSDEPVLSLGPGEYDRLMIALNQVIEVDGRFYAIFHGSGTPKKPRLWSTAIAVSDDLIHWKKYDRNPLRPATENKSSGQLLRVDGQWRLYTMHDRVDLHVNPSP